MTKPKLMYFDFPASRGEECRLALHLAGVEFDDVRIKFADWASLKPMTPFGSMPVLELPGQPPLAQCNAILTLIGRRHGLHPRDDFEAARHEAVMSYVEDLRHAISPSMHTKDEDEKKRAREHLSANVLPAWGANVEKQIGAGPFFGGPALNVVDLKLFITVRWIAGGTLDHVPANIFAPFAKLNRVYESVRDHASVKAWYARS